MFIFIAILSYFFTALAAVFDKFLISSKRVAHPATYTFYLGFFSFFTLIIFSPFGFHLIAFSKMIQIFFFSSFFTFGLLALFFNFRKNEASRVIPIVGVFTTLTSFFISLFLFNNSFGFLNLLGIFFLILGGITISLKFSKKEVARIFDGFLLAVFSGIFLGIAFSSFKYFYEQGNFFNVFIWTRLGVFLSAMSLVIIPSWRKQIISSFKGFGKNKKKETRTSILFVGNKILGGLGSILFNLAVSLGSVAVVNALVATEYVFVFAISLALSFKFPKIFKESGNSKVVVQKITAIIIIGIGIFLVK